MELHEASEGVGGLRSARGKFVLETSVTSSQNGPRYIHVRARNVHQMVVGGEDTFSLVGGRPGGGFIDQDTRISKRFSSRGTATPSERLSLNASHADASTVCSRFFSSSFSVSLSLSPVSPPFSLPLDFSLRSPRRRSSTTLLAFRTLAQNISRRPRRKHDVNRRRGCHILAYERSWIQLHEVSETRHGSAGQGEGQGFSSVNISEMHLGLLMEGEGGCCV